MADIDTSVRLNKYLALQLGISRREADDLIADKAVLVNDKPITLGARIKPTDSITVKGKPVQTAIDYEYILFNKPVGYVCSRKQQGDAPTIYSIIPEQYHTLKPVGRLDKDSSGILVLTNDGDFAHSMTHPSFYKTKVYEATLDHDLEPLHQQMISDYGIALEDGPSKLSLEKMNDDSRTEWRITMHEGRNRQIRRTFSSLGYTVIKLHRTHFGSYTLDDLPFGEIKQTKKL